MRTLVTRQNMPRWIIFTCDLGIVLFSIILSNLLRFNFRIPHNEILNLRYVIPIIIIVRAVSFFYFKTYAGIIMYTSTRDAVRIFLTLSAGSVFFIVVNIFSRIIENINIIPFSIIILEFIITVLFMTGGRVSVKILYAELKNPTREKTNVIIYGAGDAGVIAKRAIDRDAGSKYKVMAFVDDDENKKKKYLEGIPIYDAKTELENLLKNNEVKHLIIAIQNISPQRKKEIIESCMQYDTKVLNVPPVTNWINGELSFKQIKKIKIEDLLNRDPIQLDVAQIKNEIGGKTILITGAAGSIGSEIVRQIIPFHPKNIVMLDSAESPLYELELDIAESKKNFSCETVVGDIRNAERLRNVFKTFRPDIVFHAAAYKHVPVMENNPSESIFTNVLGTKVMADLANEFRTKKFVMISTDKAVNPTSIMGATKRIAEIYIQSLNKHSECKFITTRFGNVLGSNGSVIPRFKKQIEAGQPVTVTHPDITRYFMTISEACQLVLEAGAMGKGGEVFIFDMGAPVKIAELAKKMIKLYGLTLGKDIQIDYTGLRAGEKLFEELLADHENTLPTHHQKIMIAKVKEYDFENISDEIKELIGLFDTQNNDAIVKKMKLIVPEFISQNSVYEKLDRVNEHSS
ncbi:MAG TPA: nucleoside-diphosphate sugar epimerase/dehydratase [Bacteroidia bacterium]|nr:nucleoside-diphosphate sugar epimerase/dehydratase [Bacteroidia bacterium]